MYFILNVNVTFLSECSDMFEIRDFREEDAVMLAQISNEAFKDEITWGMPTFTQKTLVELSKRPGVKVFVAENREEGIAGFLTLTEGSVEMPAQIHLVAVRRGLRRKGIGKGLVRKAIEHAKNIRRKKLKLLTRPWNVAMSKLCADLGFVPEAFLRREYLDKDLVLYSAFLE